MTSPDIRAGIALLIAAMSAKGTSRIDNIAQICLFIHISEPTRLLSSSYAVFCLKKKKARPSKEWTIRESPTKPKETKLAVNKKMVSKLIAYE